MASIRGKKGGYILACPPYKIFLGEVIRYMSGSLLPVAPSAKMHNSVFIPIWNDVEKAIATVVDTITLEDIKNKVKDINSSLNYQI